MAFSIFKKKEITVLTLPCSKVFEVTATPYSPNASGSSKLIMTYRYDSKNLFHINYEHFYHNLKTFLDSDLIKTKTYGLSLAENGLAPIGGTFERGDTLYMAPDLFSEADFISLDKCLIDNQRKIKDAFASTVIKDSWLLGLISSETKIGLHGIGRLIFANSPFIDVYEGWGEYLALTHDGLVYTGENLTANSNSTRILLGKISPKETKKIEISPEIMKKMNRQKIDVHLKMKNSKDLSLEDDGYSFIYPKE